MRAVLTTACEIAEALAFVHGIGVLHGDLTAANVLLASGRSTDPRDPRPFTAKVRLESGRQGSDALPAAVPQF
jgi:serine/threonine protein kinase